MRIIGLVITLALILLAMGDVTTFIDIPSALFVIGLTVGGLIFSGAGIPNMFSASFSVDATNEELLAAARAWAQARSYLLASGFLDTLIGAVIMLKNMDDPAAIGPEVALALLTVLYGLVLCYGVCLPQQSRLEDRARD